MIVMKFGGTSVAGAAQMRQVAQILRRFARRKPVVVVSALAGVTDELLALARAAARDQTGEIRRLTLSLKRRHEETARALGLERDIGPYGRAAGDHWRTGLYDELAELNEVLHGITLLRESGKRSLDLVMSFGERLSARLLASYLVRIGQPARDVDARDMIVTDDTHGGAHVDIPATGRRCRSVLRPLLRAGRMPIVTGFIGRSRQGATTTLGRSGSDYTAALLGEALRADEIWVWKEVDGVCTADPRIVASARVVPRLSYEEAAELSHFGAQVIHPRTMQPARRAGIRIRIKNTFRPGGAGTVIGSRPGRRGGPLLVGGLKPVALVTITGSGIYGRPGMVLRLLSPVAVAGASIYMLSMSSSEYSISFAIGDADVNRTARALEQDFREQGLLGEDVARLTIERDMALMSVVGAGMRGQHGIAGRIFSALGDHGVNVVAIAQGSSEYNVTVIMKASAMERAVRAVHDRLNAGRLPSVRAHRPLQAVSK
jgi:aspartate kinase